MTTACGAVDRTDATTFLNAVFSVSPNSVLAYPVMAIVPAIAWVAGGGGGDGGGGGGGDGGGGGGGKGGGGEGGGGGGGEGGGDGGGDGGGGGA